MSILKFLRLESSVLVTALFCCVILCLRSDAALLSEPYDLMFEKIGSTVRLQCLTDIVDKFIYIQRNQKYIYFDNTLIESLAPRYNVSVNDSGQAGLTVLTIRNVSLEDAGQYTCADNDGYGSDINIDLVVIDNKLTCKHNINSVRGFVPAELSCTNAIEYVNVSCLLVYRGPVAPTLNCYLNGPSSRQSGNKDIGTPNISSGTNAWFGVYSATTGSNVVCSTLKSNSSRTLVTWQSPPIQSLFYSRSEINNEPSGEDLESVCSIETEVKNAKCEITIEKILSSNGLVPYYRCVKSCMHEGESFCAQSNWTELPHLEERAMARLQSGINDLRKERKGLIAVCSFLFVMCLVMTISHCLPRYRRCAERKRILDGVRLLRHVPEQYVLKTNGTHITGVDVLNGFLYVTYERNPKVDVFNSTKPYEVCQSIPVPGMTVPRDIVACPKKNCLFVVDESGEVFKLWRDDGHTLLFKSAVVQNMKVEKPHTLSIDSEERIIALQYVTKHSLYEKPEHSITIHRYTEKDGQATNNLISLPEERDNYAHPQHAIQTIDYNKNYLVCYGKKLIMCKISGAGRVIEESYTTVLEKDVNYAYLSVNNENGNFFVTTDYGIFEFEQNTLCRVKNTLSVLEDVQNATQLCVLGEGLVLIGTRYNGAFVIPSQCIDDAHKAEILNLVNANA